MLSLLLLEKGTSRATKDNTFCLSVTQSQMRITHNFKDYWRNHRHHAESKILEQVP